MQACAWDRTEFLPSTSRMNYSRRKRMTDPQRRYQSAQELAEDLSRFLDHKPIQARPAGAPGRTWKWCRRRPALAGLGVSIVLALVLGSAGVLWEWRQARDNARLMIGICFCAPRVLNAARVIGACGPTAGRSSRLCPGLSARALGRTYTNSLPRPCRVTWRESWWSRGLPHLLPPPKAPVFPNSTERYVPTT